MFIKSSRLVLTAFILHVSLFGLSQIKGLDLLGEKDKLVLPFEYKNGFILIPIKYNNFLPLNFILDTGAEHTILFKRELNDLFGLPYDQRVEVIGSDLSEILVAYICRNVPVKLNPDLTVERDVIVLEEDKMRLDEITGIPIDGIIGAGFFRNLIVRFDFKKKKIHFYHPDKYDYTKLKDYSSYGIEIINRKPYIIGPTQINDQDTFSLKYLIDTGASLPLLIHFNADSSLLLPQKVITGNLAMGLGGNLKGYVGKIKKFELGQYAFNNVISYFQEVRDSKEIRDFTMHREGIIGTGFLSRFDMAIDYLNKKLYLKPNKNFKKEFKYDRSGLILFAFGPNLDKFYVTGIIDDSPAARAGIKKGDIITKIGIWGTKYYTLEKLTKKFSGKEGKTIKLTINRAGKKLKKRFKLKELF